MTVDAAACVRCGACAVLAPRTFEVDRKGTRVIAPIASSDRDVVRAAELVCPTQAIRITRTE